MASNSTPQLSVTGLAPGAVSLSWPASTDLLFSAYEVERSTAGATGPWVSLASLGSASSTTFYGDGLLPGQTYWWVVLYNTTLGTTPSSVVQATQPPVAAMSAALGGPTSVLLGWTNSAVYGGNLQFLSYSVTEALGSGPSIVLANITSESTRSLNVTNLAPGSSYRYWVETTDGCAAAANCGTALQPSNSNSSSASTTTPGALTASASASSTSLSTGASDNFTCRPSGGVPPYHYSWTFGDGTGSHGRTVAHAFYVAGVYTVTCTVSDLLGSTANGSVSVTVHTAAGGGGTGRGNGSGNGTGSGPGNGSNPNGTGTPGGTPGGKPGTGRTPVTTPTGYVPTARPFDPLLIGLLAAIVVACVGLLIILMLGRARRPQTGPGGPPPGASSAAAPRSSDPAVHELYDSPPSTRPPPGLPSPPVSADAASRVPTPRPAKDGLDIDGMMDDLESAVQHARKRGRAPTRWW